MEESDTESVVSLSCSVGPDLVVAAQEVIEEEPQLAEFRISEALRDALVSLDDVNVETEFWRRANLIQSPPKFLKGAYVSAVRLAMEEVREGRRTNNDARRIRGWKLFLMIPRMLLVKPRKGSLMPKSKLLERVAQFAQERWIAFSPPPPETKMNRLSVHSVESGTTQPTTAGRESGARQETASPPPV